MYLLFFVMQDESAGEPAAAELAATALVMLSWLSCNLRPHARMCLLHGVQDESSGELGAAELAAMARLSGPEGAATLAARRKALGQLR
jgi:hypothetical protein